MKNMKAVTTNTDLIGIISICFWLTKFYGKISLSYPNHLSNSHQVFFDSPNMFFSKSFSVHNDTKDMEWLELERILDFFKVMKSYMFLQKFKLVNYCGWLKFLYQIFCFLDHQTMIQLVQIIINWYLTFLNLCKKIGQGSRLRFHFPINNLLEGSFNTLIFHFQSFLFVWP